MIRWRRTVPAWGVLALTGASLVTIGHVVGVGAADPAVVPVEIEGSGDSDIVGELVDWQNTMFASSVPTDIQYFERGTKEGRAQLLSGEADFAISGVPFTAAELASRPEGAGAIIDVPVMNSALAILVTTPPQSGWNTEVIDVPCINDPDLEDPEVCITRGVYDGPIRIPAENLSALFLGLSPSYRQNHLAQWNSPGMEAALGTSALAIQGQPSQHTFVDRTEGSAANKYLQAYAKELGPQAWALRQQENPEFAWEPIGEQFSPRTMARNGSATQIGLIAIANVDAATNGTPGDWVGNAGAVPANQVSRILSDFPNAKFRVVEVQNRHGDWVAPSTETIGAATAAGTSPNIGATNDVAGAYPLTWVTRLYTVAGTLTPDQANGLAATIRYLVTDGQSDVVADGGAALSPALRAEALAGANEIVAANCTADGYEVVLGPPSAFEPDTPGVRQLTSLAHCVPKPAPATTTTAEPTTTVSSSASSTSTTPATVASYGPPIVFPTQPVFDVPIDETTTTSTLTTTDESNASAETSTTTATGGAASRVRGRPLGSLPLALPSDGAGGFKKTGTLMLGASMFLLLRRFLQARARAAP